MLSISSWASAAVLVVIFVVIDIIIAFIAIVVMASQNVPAQGAEVCWPDSLQVSFAHATWASVAAAAAAPAGEPFPLHEASVADVQCRNDRAWDAVSPWDPVMSTSMAEAADRGPIGAAVPQAVSANGFRPRAVGW